MPNHLLSRRIVVLLIGFYSITVVTTESLSISSQESSSSKEGSLLTFLLKHVNNSASNKQQPQNPDNNADIQEERGQLYLFHKDNDNDNNDRLRYRREDVNTQSSSGDGSKVISTNWGTYEEQAPVVVQSESRTIDTAAEATHDDDDGDAAPTFSDEYQSREHDDSGEYSGPGSITYDDYESGRFEGRQFYPSRGGTYENSEQQDGYYRQKYYATTARPLNEQRQPFGGEEGDEREPQANRPRYPYRRPQYRPPQRKEKDEGESTGSGIVGFLQKAKQFYDIFRAMNSAWKTVEDHYRKTGEGIFPEDLKKMNESQRIALNMSTNIKRPQSTETPTAEDKQQDAGQDNDDETRSRRSSDNEKEGSAFNQSSESDLESLSSSSSGTAVAEGRYIKGDPLKGYYDFVITEGSYKFWAAFQVGTALLIIYSTFAAIYYSKVNPLVSDYDYIDYLGGGRSLSDDSDFVDTDVPTENGGATPDASSRVSSGTTTGGASRSRQQSSAGWFGWLPHAGHTLQFILESIEKEYSDE